MTNFTSGEWKVEYLGKAPKIATNDNLIAEINFKTVGHDEAEANAKLIAEAPAMYGIVKRVLFMFGNEANYPEGTVGYKLSQEATEIINRIEKSS